jgi:tetratricopeptide (TPR) repeat protein
MTNETEHIDRYLAGQLTEEERRAFEGRIESDPAFAEEVALQLSVLAAARESVMEETKARFRAMHAERMGGGQGNGKVISFPWVRRAMSVAAVLLVATLGWVFFLRPPSPESLAREYVSREWSRTGVNMGGEQDALTPARELFNGGDLPGAAKYLDSLLEKEPANAEAEKLSGVVSLRLGDHDKALLRFRALAKLPGLYANPGRFLEAVTLMDRNGAGDREKAKEALEQVVREGLGGHEQAEAWLKKF